MRFPLSFEHNVESLAGPIDVVLPGNQSHRDSLIYFDNYVIIGDLDKTFAPIIKVIIRDTRSGALINKAKGANIIQRR